MIPRIRLFVKDISLRQVVVAGWLIALLGIVTMWAPLAALEVQSGLSGFFLTIGQLLGLLATFFALTQFLLMGRIPWIERSISADRLARYHRLNGYLSISLIIAHPVFLTLHHMALEQIDAAKAYVDIYLEHPYTFLALIAEILFIGVVVSSIYIVRKHLTFEAWYYVHIAVYVAITLASFHQFANGGTLIASPVARGFWLCMYLFVAVNIVVWRFGAVILASVRYEFSISRVVRETSTVVSVYIKAKHAERLRVKPGQYIFVRFLTKALWWQEHPFTVSWIPHNDELRITVRNVGDYTASMARLKPGTRVAISGPFGRLTSEEALTDKKILIAGGIGITPLRCLFEEASRLGKNTVLLYANKTSDDVPLKSELDMLANPMSKIYYTYSEDRVKGAGFGHIDLAMIAAQAPDYRHGDIYICGPPAMIKTLTNQLSNEGVPSERIHHELFSLYA